MSDVKNNNLIDLMMIGDKITLLPINSITPAPISNTISPDVNFVSPSCVNNDNTFDLNNTANERIKFHDVDSNSNNPFDDAERNVRLFDDPFEIVLQEQITNRTLLGELERNKMRTENLLQLTEDAPILKSPEQFADEDHKSSIPENSDTLDSSTTLDKKELNSDGSVSLKIVNDIVDNVNETIIDETTVTLRNKTGADTSQRHTKLLKDGLRNILLKRTHSNASSSPQNSEQRVSLTSECLSTDFPECSSNLWQDSCEDLWSVKPNWIDSEPDIDSDLEIMKIPFLEEYNTKRSDKKSILDHVGADCSEAAYKLDSENQETSLSQLKEKFKHFKSNKYFQDVNTLINNLKSLVGECKNKEKKVEACGLLESLGSLFANHSITDTTCNTSNDNSLKCKSTEVLLTPPNLPQPLIIRQGTFDLDIKENKNLPDADEDRSGLTKPEPTKRSPTTIFLASTPIGKTANSYGNSPTNRRRAQSFSLYNNDKKYQKPNQATEPTTISDRGIKTPIRSSYLSRRDSISRTTVPFTSTINTNVKRSGYGQTIRKSETHFTTIQQRRSIAADSSRNLPAKIIPSTNLKPELNAKKNLKFKANELKTRTKGPLKAMLPLGSTTSGPVNKNPISIPIATVQRVRSPPNACSTPMSSSVLLRKSSLIPNSNHATPLVQRNRPRSFSATPTGIGGIRSIKLPLDLSGTEFRNINEFRPPLVSSLNKENNRL